MSFKMARGLLAAAICTFVMTASAPAWSAECAGKTVVECADFLAEKLASLTNEHAALMKELRETKEDVKKQLDSMRKIESGSTSVNKEKMYQHVTFTPGYFTKKPSVAFGVGNFFNGLIKGQFYGTMFAIENLDVNGFDIRLLDHEYASADDILWVAIQK